MKKVILYFFTFVLAQVQAQILNDYQYIVVPKQYTFQKIQNQYRINSLTKFLFEKNNFKTFWEDADFPADYNPCKALRAIVDNESNLFVTRVKINLVDCKGKTIFTTSQGKSREKDFVKSYDEAIRNAFADLAKIKYAYQPQSAENIVKSEEKPSEEKQIPATEIIPILTALPLGEGFLLFDNEQKKTFTLTKSQLSNVFTAIDTQGQKGLFYKENAYYIFEYNQNGEVFKKKFVVNFPQ